MCLECTYNEYQARGHLQSRLVRVNEPLRQPAYVFEGFRLDAQHRVLFGADGNPIALTPRLFDALLYFVERAGQLLTKKQLLEAIGPRVVVEEHNLNKTISELRRVLGEKPGEHRFFVTKPGQGYRFVASVSAESASAPPSPSGTEELANSPVEAARNAVALEAISNPIAATTQPWWWSRNTCLPARRSPRSACSRLEWAGRL